jgi:hypothetical protein
MRNKKYPLLVAAAIMTAAAASAPGQVRPATQIATVGQPVNGSGSLTVTDLNTAYVSGNDKVGFFGTLSDTSRFIFFDNAIRFRNTDVASPTLTGGEGTVGVGNLGEFVYSPTIEGNDSIWSHIGLLHRAGQPAPGLPGQFNTTGSRPHMAADGTAFWFGGLSNTQGGSTAQDVLWRATTTGGTPSYTPLLRGGATVGSDTISQTGLELTYDVSDNGQNYIIEVDFDGPTTADGAVVLNGNTIVAREGSPVPDGGGNWQGFRNMGVNSAGNWVVYGDDNSTTDDILVHNNTLIARQGTPAPGGLTYGGTVDAAAINESNQIIHIWDLTSSTDEGLFVTDGTNVASTFLLLRTGDPLDTTGDGTADFTLTDFNASSTITHPLDFGDNGLVYLDVDLTPIGGGTAVQSIISVAVPEPGALALLGIGALGLLRRRK